VLEDKVERRYKVMFNRILLTLFLLNVILPAWDRNWSAMLGWTCATIGAISTWRLR